MGWLDVLLGPLGTWWDRRTSVGYKGQARVCTHDHVPIWFEGEDERQRQQPAHLDVELELWTRGRERISLLKDELEAAAGGQALIGGNDFIPGDTFPGATLDHGGPPVEVDFTLRPTAGEALRAGRVMS